MLEAGGKLCSFFSLAPQALCHLTHAMEVDKIYRFSAIHMEFFIFQVRKALLHQIEVIVLNGAWTTLLILNRRILMAWMKTKLVTWISKIH